MSASHESLSPPDYDSHEHSEVDTQSTDSLETKRRKFDAYSVCAFAITITIGGQMYGWNAWLRHGFGMFMFAEMLMAVAYFVYVCSIAEIVSGFPFSGGGYGLARVAQGYYIGFLVGCCEVLEYIAYSALSFLYVSEILCLIFHVDSQYSILFCLLCYFIAVMVTIHKSRLLVYTNYIIAGLSLLTILLYCFGSLKWANFAHNASLHLHSSRSHSANWFRGGMSQFMATLPEATVFYGGIEALSLLPSLCNEPRTSIPRGLVMGMCVLFVVNIMAVFVVASMPGGIEATSKLPFPLEIGYDLIFNCPRLGTLLVMLPAQFGQGFGFVLPYGKLLQALGTTNLMPSCLRLNNCDNHTNGVIVGSCFGFALCILCEFLEGENLAHICILAGFLTYLSQLHGYWMLKTSYSSAVREFSSPFGLFGVLFAAVMFLLGIAGIIGFSHNYVTVGFIGVYLIILSVYYHLFAAKTQTIAKEEQAVLFQLHVAKQNRRRKKRPAASAAAAAAAQKKHRTKLKATVVAACADGGQHQPQVGRSLSPSGELAAAEGSLVMESYADKASSSMFETINLYEANHGHENTFQSEVVIENEKSVSEARYTYHLPVKFDVVKEEGVEIEDEQDREEATVVPTDELTAAKDEEQVTDVAQNSVV